MDHLVELETPVVRMACRSCADDVEMTVDGEMARTMREFFEAHLSGSAVIEIRAVREDRLAC